MILSVMLHHEDVLYLNQDNRATGWPTFSFYLTFFFLLIYKCIRALSCPQIKIRTEMLPGLECDCIYPSGI